MLGPDYSRPPILIPANYRGVVGAPAAESFADLPWFDVFRDPVLRALVREALQNNYDLRIAAIAKASPSAIVTRAEVVGTKSCGQLSCSTPVSAAAGKKVTTIEGLSPAGTHPLQKAWIAEQVPQCGYCQSGQIMQAAALLAKNKKPTREQIVTHMNGNLCRCGTYNGIVRAIQRASKEV
jgi:aerobic-type carbon monoxide dehydrogenase small subunit (CoxS/CutS family)